MTAQQIMAVIPAEIRATVKLYLDGKIQQWYSRGDGKGVIFLINANTEDEARAIVETLPLAEEELIDHEYIPVGPLMPLRALMGPVAQQNTPHERAAAGSEPFRRKRRPSSRAGISIGGIYAVATLFLR